jgi:hypothetical protein
LEFVSKLNYADIVQGFFSFTTRYDTEALQSVPKNNKGLNSSSIPQQLYIGEIKYTSDQIFVVY